MQFGEKLRKLRQDRNLTQPDLAEELGIEQSWLSKLENDKSLPSSDLLDRVCQVFGLTLEQVLADLDNRYLRNQLASLPEVRGLLQEKRYTLVHNARRWLLTATACVALGVTLFLCGNDKWVFSEDLFRYESQGLVFEGEPENLFVDKEEALRPITITQVDQLWERRNTDPEQLEKYLFTNMRELYDIEFEKNLAKLQPRQNTDTQMSNKLVGDYYRIETTAPKASTDIYGNPVAAGTPAHRIYVFEKHVPNPRWQNSLFKLLGVFLATAGLLLYFVEWRIAKTTKVV